MDLTRVPTILYVHMLQDTLLLATDPGQTCLAAFVWHAYGVT